MSIKAALTRHSGLAGRFVQNQNSKIFKALDSHSRYQIQNTKFYTTMEEPNANKDFDKENLAASRSQHPGSKKENTPENEGGGKENENPKSGGDFANRARGGLDGSNSAKSALKDAKDVGEAAEGNPFAIARLLKKHGKKIILGAIGSCLINPITWALALVILLVIIVAGSSASISEDLVTGLCKNIKPLSADEQNQMLSSPYTQTLKEAEQATGTSYLLIFAVDAEVNKMGLKDFPNIRSGPDTRTALINIGKQIQEANYERGANGRVTKDASGNPVKGLPNITGKSTDNVAVAIALERYKCVFIKNGDRSANLDDPSLISDCFNQSSQTCLQQIVGWSDASGDHPGDPWMINLAPNASDPGAFMFYLQLAARLGGVCSDKGAIPIGSIGVPGARDTKNMPVLTNYKQGNWCAPDNPAPWAGDPFMGGTMADSGCSITSASMVLRWYGCDIDPGKADKLPGVNNYNFSITANACGMCVRSIPGKQAVDDFLASTHEPMIVNVNSRMDGHPLPEGHFVAVVGYDGSNYYAYDPGACGGVFTVPSATFEGYMAGSPGTNTAFYKPSNGGCQ